ncbi:Hsp20/alpha crystallin family protein [Hyunsoonleella flava]|uniref:Hsp20/alpha crystallin family protein n=1 Tax=Hyunsoonleella flava TaxID=2527939 RepID=A0A4Q9FJK7_9FLAO|nr:Hsp20/alpha crystallin family protein [Hyunsoonleella flava]TBN04346.1 Hsp20/alpha crystallin family protein [Hyunsoonleella flava]
MTTLSKRRRRNGLSPLENRLFTPWRNNLLRPWGRRLFPSDFDELNSLSRFDDIFEDDFFESDSLMPAMNVKEHEEDFEIELAAPGFNKKDFEVTIEEDVLQVCAEKEAEEEKEDNDYSRKEFSYKSFKRSMVLPTSVDLEQDVKASYKNGILKVKLLKKEDVIEKEPPKKVIEVN